MDDELAVERGEPGGATEPGQRGQNNCVTFCPPWLAHGDPGRNDKCPSSDLINQQAACLPWHVVTKTKRKTGCHMVGYEIGQVGIESVGLRVVRRWAPPWQTTLRDGICAQRKTTER
ncbi:hypothetical protein R1flu_008403 [Riccia fluitans]|uniref:Uncharacterized protein n=1 Tax=Riccia fluitans TaxID=41844 RepID=A0ABD1YBL9_9MARC